MTCMIYLYMDGNIDFIGGGAELVFPPPLSKLDHSILLGLRKGNILQPGLPHERWERHPHEAHQDDRIFYVLYY